MTVNQLLETLQYLKWEGCGENEVVINGQWTIDQIEKPVKQSVVFMTTKGRDNVTLGPG